VLRWDPDALILKTRLNRTVTNPQRHADARTIGGILDCIIEKNQKQFVQEGLISSTGEFLVQITYDGHILRARARGG